MMFRCFSLTTLFLIALPEMVPAQDQATMNQQAAKSADAADKELNAVYKKVTANLDDEGKALLKTSQLAWLAYRDAEAKFAADEMRDGSGAPLLLYGSMARITRERVAVLKTYLGEEGPAEEEKAPTPTEPAAPLKVTYISCLAYAGSSQLLFKDAAGNETSVGVMSKAQRTGMAPEEPYVKYPEKMIGGTPDSESDANPAMVGKSFFLIMDKEGEVVEIKAAP
jgi:uncharacterized protein YecT (DUF1311 family)